MEETYKLRIEPDISGLTSQVDLLKDAMNLAFERQFPGLRVPDQASTPLRIGTVTPSTVQRMDIMPVFHSQFEDFSAPPIPGQTQEPTATPLTDIFQAMQQAWTKPVALPIIQNVPVIGPITGQILTTARQFVFGEPPVPPLIQPSFGGFMGIDPEEMQRRQRLYSSFVNTRGLPARLIQGGVMAAEFIPFAVSGLSLTASILAYMGLGAMGFNFPSEAMSEEISTRNMIRNAGMVLPRLTTPAGLGFGQREIGELARTIGTIRTELRTRGPADVEGLEEAPQAAFETLAITGRIGPGTGISEIQNMIRNLTNSMVEIAREYKTSVANAREIIMRLDRIGISFEQAPHTIRQMTTAARFPGLSMNQVLVAAEQGAAISAGMGLPPEFGVRMATAGVYLGAGMRAFSNLTMQPEQFSQLIQKEIYKTMATPAGRFMAYGMTTNENLNYINLIQSGGSMAAKSPTDYLKFIASSGDVANQVSFNDLIQVKSNFSKQLLKAMGAPITEQTLTGLLTVTENMNPEEARVLAKTYIELPKIEERQAQWQAFSRTQERAQARYELIPGVIRWGLETYVGLRALPYTLGITRQAPPLGLEAPGITGAVTHFMESYRLGRQFYRGIGRAMGEAVEPVAEWTRNIFDRYTDVMESFRLSTGRLEYPTELSRAISMLPAGPPSTLSSEEFKKIGWTDVAQSLGLKTEKATVQDFMTKVERVRTSIGRGSYELSREQDEFFMEAFANAKHGINIGIETINKLKSYDMFANMDAEQISGLVAAYAKKHNIPVSTKSLEELQARIGDYGVEKLKKFREVEKENPIIRSFLKEKELRNIPEDKRAVLLSAMHTYTALEKLPEDRKERAKILSSLGIEIGKEEEFRKDLKYKISTELTDAKFKGDFTTFQRLVGKYEAEYPATIEKFVTQIKELRATGVIAEPVTTEQKPLPAEQTTLMSDSLKEGVKALQKTAEAASNLERKLARSELKESGKAGIMSGFFG